MIEHTHDLMAAASPARNPIDDVPLVADAATRLQQISRRRSALEAERSALAASLGAARNTGGHEEEPLDAALHRVIEGAARPPQAPDPEHVQQRINEIGHDLGVLAVAEGKASAAFYRARVQAAADRLAEPDADRAIRRVVAAAETLCREMAAARAMMTGLSGAGWPVTDTDLGKTLQRANAAAVSPDIFAHWLAELESVAGRPLTGLV